MDKFGVRAVLNAARGRRIHNFDSLKIFYGPSSVPFEQTDVHKIVVHKIVVHKMYYLNSLFLIQDPCRWGGEGKTTCRGLFWPQKFLSPLIRREKRAQRLTFWVRRPPGGVGVFHAKGWWPKSSCPPSKVCLPWVSKTSIRDVPRNFAGMSWLDSWGCSKSLCKKSSCTFFVPYLNSCNSCVQWKNRLRFFV